MINGCEYPGRPEPCEGYREVMDEINRILTILTKSAEFAHMHWVGKNYSKADLIRDLNQLREKE